MIADIEIDEYKEPEADERTSRDPVIKWKDRRQDRMKCHASDPVLDPEPQTSHERSDQSRHCGAFRSEHHLRQDRETGSITGTEFSEQNGRDQHQGMSQDTDKQRLIPGQACCQKGTRHRIDCDRNENTCPKRDIVLHTPVSVPESNRLCVVRINVLVFLDLADSLIRQFDHK